MSPSTSTSITATAPAHAAGKVDVVVTNTDSQSATLTQAFTYVLPAPTISSVSPNTGPTTGGTPVTITGTNFQSGATVTFGALPATDVIVVSDDVDHRPHAARSGHRTTGGRRLRHES